MSYPIEPRQDQAITEDRDPEFSYISATLELLSFLYPKTSSLEKNLENELNSYKNLKTQGIPFKPSQDSKLFYKEDLFDPWNLLLRLQIKDCEFLEFEGFSNRIVDIPHKKIVVQLNCFRSEIFQAFQKILWCFGNLVAIIYQDFSGVFRNAERFREKWKYSAEIPLELYSFAEILCFLIDTKSQPLILILQF